MELQPQFNLEAFKEHTNKLTLKTKSPTVVVGLFLVRTANNCMESAKTRPIPKMLFDEFFYEGELCILFSDTNVGKSILAVQIGDSISRGTPIPGFKLQTNAQTVLYFDFELSEKQFENRYAEHYTNHYHWNDFFYRIEMNPNSELPKNYTFEQFLMESLEQAIIQTHTKVIIIDNITYLKNDTERAKDASPLMQCLKELKVQYQLSILVLAHTPKRDKSKKITNNDLLGSKMLSNFADSIFVIGESFNDKSLRYLKQTKVRQNEFVYDSENVCICTLNKPSNFLQFEFMGYGSEKEHLKEISEKDNLNQIEKIKELKQQGKSLRIIGTELEISHQKVKRILDKNNHL